MRAEGRPLAGVDVPAGRGAEYLPDARVQIEYAGAWHAGRVVARRGSGVHVHYTGWSRRHDETRGAELPSESNRSV